MIQHKKRYPSSFDYCYKVTAMLCAMMMVSCSSDSDTVMVDEGKPISFSLDNESQARAIVNSFTEFTANNFGVTAYWYADGDITKTPQVAINNQKINVNGSGCTIDGGYKYYWTKGTWHFSAYSPWVANPATAPVKVTTPSSIYGGYTFSGTVNGETDYMFADEQPGYYEVTGSNSLQSFNGSPVPMTFRHALTKVTFSVQLADADGGNNKLTFSNVSLSNIRNKGNVAFTHGGLSADRALYSPNDRNRWLTKDANGGETNDIWSVDNNSKVPYSIVTNVAPITDDSVHDLDKVLYLMPQELQSSGADAQKFDVSYTLQIGSNDATTHTVSIPVYTSTIPRWCTNSHVHYTLTVNPPGGTVSLAVHVQPWEHILIENEFADVVGMEGGGLLQWKPETVASDDQTNNIVTIKPDISQYAQFTFSIGSPVGGTWYAMLRCKRGNPYAFSLRAVENATISEGVAMGAIDHTTVRLEVVSNEPNPTVQNEYELIFTVKSNGKLLPADVVVGDDEINYTIIQEINI